MKFILSIFSTFFLFLSSYSAPLCFKDLNGNGNFDLNGGEVANCTLSADGTSYLCPIDKQECVLEGQCPSTCCWQGNPPVFNVNTLKCETDPGLRWTYPGYYISSDPYSKYQEDFSGYDVSRKCFVDANNNCLSDTATVSVSANAGDKLRPWGEISRRRTMNTRAGVEVYVDGSLYDSAVINQDPYTWGSRVITYTASAPSLYTFTSKFYGYTPEADTKIAVRVRFRWQNKDGIWTIIGWYGTGYDNTDENNKKVVDYSLYLDTGEKFEISFERHPAMYQGQVQANIKMAVALEYPDGSVSYLGVKSCSVDWLTGWWGNCGGWGTVDASMDGTYKMHMKVYVQASNPGAWGDNAYLMLIRVIPDCHWQYPLNPATGKCEGIPTQVDWACPSGNYSCVPENVNGTTVYSCSSASACTDQFGSSSTCN